MSSTAIVTSGGSIFVTTGGSIVSSVSQYGITWTFSAPAEVGQFVTGDYYVIGPVTVSSVTPAPDGAGPEAIHFNGVTWTESTLALSAVGAFADYVHASGNTVEISGGTGATPGTYDVASKISDDEVRLTSSIGSGADGVGNTYGDIINTAYKTNGSAVNPIADSTNQPYDGRRYGGGASNYDFAQQGVSFPLALNPGDSLVSTISRPAGDIDRSNLIGDNVSIGKTKLSDAAVLTCLASAPSSLAFRPPFAGTSKPVYLVSALRTDLLPSLTPPTYADIHAAGIFSSGVYGTSDSPGKAYARFFQRPWLSHVMGDTGENIRAINNCPGYYSGAHTIESEAAVLLCCDPDASVYFGEAGGSKLDLLYGYVQHGIDEYYIVQTNPNPTSRGDRCISKGPMIFAGTMLDVTAMKTSLNYTHPTYGTEFFKSEVCTYTGTAWTNATYRPTAYNTALFRSDPTDSSDPALANYEHLDPFTTGWCSVDIGGNSAWRSEAYRRSTHSFTWVGMGLAARLLGSVTDWGHQAFFDYCDRWMNEDESGFFTALDTLGGTNPCSDSSGPWTLLYGSPTLPSQQFVADMWASYR